MKIQSQPMSPSIPGQCHLPYFFRIFKDPTTETVKTVIETASIDAGLNNGFCSWWRMTGSNRRPPACKAGALPAELIPPVDHRKCLREPSRARRSIAPHTHWYASDATTPPCAGYREHLVGLDGFEPSTPALSRRCSNQLSYRPAVGF